MNHILIRLTVGYPDLLCSKHRVKELSIGEENRKISKSVSSLSGSELNPSTVHTEGEFCWVKFFLADSLLWIQLVGTKDVYWVQRPCSKDTLVFILIGLIVLISNLRNNTCMFHKSEAVNTLLTRWIEHFTWARKSRKINVKYSLIFLPLYSVFCLNKFD